jgi:hypothetical protein
VKKLFVFVFVACASLSLLAQDSTNISGTRIKADRKSEKRQRINAMMKQEEEGNLSYTKQSIFGIQLRTNGYGFFYEMGRRSSPRWTTVFTGELTEIKSDKEEKLGGSQNFFGNSFIYGKINNFYQFKLGAGRQYIFGQKGNKNGVAIIGTVQGGFDLGFLKPYYVDIQDSSGLDKTISYYQDSSNFLNPVAFYGSAGFGKGWNELKFKPGLFIKTSLRFDFGRYNESVSAIEIGMSLEAFAQKIQIMALNDPKQLFFQGHIAFVFGKRK